MFDSHLFTVQFISLPPCILSMAKENPRTALSRPGRVGVTVLSVLLTSCHWANPFHLTGLLQESSEIHDKDRYVKVVFRLHGLLVHHRQRSASV